MLNHRRHRIFQHFYSNRLRQHLFTSFNDSDSNRATTQSNRINWCHQIDRTKCDIVTHKNQISHVNIADLIPQIPKHNTISSNQPLPFGSIPCADPSSTSIYNRMLGIAHQMKQLITTNYDHRFHEEIDECHQRLGPIFRKSLTPKCSAIFVKSPDLLRDVFTYEGKYPKHPLPEAWTYYNQLHNCQRGLLFMDDAEWMEMRRQLAPLMLRNDQRFFEAIECATDNLIHNWQQIAVNRNDWTELPQNVLTTLYGWSVRVLLNVLFGNSVGQKMCTELGDQIDNFSGVVQEIFDDTVPFLNISPHLARKLQLPIWTKFEKTTTDSLALANEIYDFGFKQPNYDGLLGELKQLNMTTDMIKRIFTDLIMAAGDTMASSTQWALYLLAKHPQCQETVRQELFTTDKHDTPLIRGTVREALRLYPVTTFIGRILAKDAILNNYVVAKNTLVYISTYSAGRDESSFPNAHQFQPNRWNRDPITGTLKSVNRAQSSIPYALGARNCIGQRIANAQMHIILSKCLRTFKVQLLNANEIDIVMRLIITPSKPMRFAVKRID